MPFMKGVVPIRYTLWHLDQGSILLRPQVKIMALCFRKKDPSPIHKGINDFVFWHWSQLQYKNPTVQIVKQPNTSPFPYFHVFLESGEEVLIDCDSKTKDEIHHQIKHTLGKTDETIARERRLREANPANFGSDFKRHCMCEVSGQWPCPELIPPPAYLTGNWRWNRNSQ